MQPYFVENIRQIKDYLHFKIFYMGIKALQNEIGRRLKHLRLEKELSQETVAFEVEISRDHLSNIENGKHPINIKTLYKLAEFFNVDMKYFF